MFGSVCVWFQSHWCRSSAQQPAQSLSYIQTGRFKLVSLPPTTTLPPPTPPPSSLPYRVSRSEWHTGTGVRACVRASSSSSSYFWIIIESFCFFQVWNKWLDSFLSLCVCVCVFFISHPFLCATKEKHKHSRAGGFFVSLLDTERWTGLTGKRIKIQFWFYIKEFKQKSFLFLKSLCSFFFLLLSMCVCVCVAHYVGTRAPVVPSPLYPPLRPFFFLFCFEFCFWPGSLWLFYNFFSSSCTPSSGGSIWNCNQFLP